MIVNIARALSNLATFRAVLQAFKFEIEPFLKLLFMYL